MAKKTNQQQYFFLLGAAPSKLNALESEILFHLQREDRTVFQNQQQLARWLELLEKNCRSLNNVHRRCTPAELKKANEFNDIINYALTKKLGITIYKSKI